MAVKKTKSSSVAKKPIVVKENKKLFDKIDTSAEWFFIGLGYKSWKAMRTRLNNTLGLDMRDTLKPNEIKLVLEHIANSSSKNKTRAKELLEIFNGNIENLPIDEEAFSEDILELEIPNTLMKKYGINSVEDVQMKIKILRNGNDIREEIKKRYERYKFEYDIRVVKLIEEMLDRGELDE